MVLAFLRKLLPRNVFQVVSLILGLLGSILYSTQIIYNWFGTSQVEKTLYSFIVLLLLVLAIGYAIVGGRPKRMSYPVRSGLIYALYGFVIIIIVVIALNGFAMQLSTDYAEQANSRLGFFEGFRMLTQVTQEDVNSLQYWAIGLKQIIKALFLIVPFLIATWGGLSVLTADSIDEGEGGILAIVAAFVVVIVVWLFKLVEITLS